MATHSKEQVPLRDCPKCADMEREIIRLRKQVEELQAAGTGTMPMAQPGDAAEL